MNSRIVCAANKYGSVIIIGIRHYDKFMHTRIQELKDTYTNLINIEDEVQGFVDQFGNFYNRKDAYIIAENENQIIRTCGNPDSRELYSENLY